MNRVTLGQLKLSVYLNYGLVTVHVVQGRHISSGSQLQPDTFVMISLIPDDDGVAPTRCRTGVVKNSSCPVFNEKFSLYANLLAIDKLPFYS
ncbi:hypothetical protein DPMN_081319 [Dreissena polymorpha]|uniref:C2 domain-containing protein n=1 Tax=Dreissena polymorpha TaxID=45954 RepID=A0A9D4BFT8_DREPO|nr:hypothetical protein DPMN_081319 [Dreissena polymorpha]